MKPVECPAKEKKWGEEGKVKVKVKTAVSILRPKSLLSAYARTLQGNILHLDQQAAKCTTCKRLCGKFVKLFIARQWPENPSTSFKRVFP